jgi:5-methylcytosine-specific restriction endonuclease McrA
MELKQSPYFSSVKRELKMMLVPPADKRAVEFFVLKLRAKGDQSIMTHHFRGVKGMDRLQVNAKTLKSFYASRRQRRMPITYELRWELSAKQKWKCATCKKLLPMAAQVDHIIPLCAGGDDKIPNMQMLCANCHAEKTRAEAKKGVGIDRGILKHAVRLSSVDKA